MIIEEQVEKLQATLRGIETLSVVARHTSSKLVRFDVPFKCIVANRPGVPVEAK